ncbi:MBG domain-containing protein [Myroides odoratus]|uniref:MBG domain-containing protein n=1 Tax=Myroides odoratus TaxID=256 RepID=UPI000765B6E3|nr:MBG domain-containing protein [Myroides odoratus]
MNPKLLLTGVLLFCCSLLVFPLNKASSFVPNENKDALPIQTEIVFSDSGEITVENPFFCAPTAVTAIRLRTSCTGQPRWYASATDATELTTITQSGTYYVELSNGNCKVERKPVEIIILTPQPPRADSTQYLCNAPTLAHMRVAVEDLYVVRWYATATSTTPLAYNTPIISGTTYYASSYHLIAGCESTRIPITATVVNTAAPTAEEEQVFCPSLQPTIANLDATGSAIKWYNAAEGSTPLAVTDRLINNRTYYASQTIHNCESSTRTAVTVRMENITRPTVENNAIEFTYGDISTPFTIDTAPHHVLVWYTTATGGQGTTVPPTIPTDAVRTFSYWISQRSPSGCESERLAIKVHVRPAKLTITPDTLTKEYGEADPTLTYTVSGFINQEDIVPLRGQLHRLPGENVGRYDLTLGSLTPIPNYTFNLVPTKFSITPAPLTITVDAKTKVYGEREPQYSYTAEGFKFSDTTRSLTGNITREPGENVGIYRFLQGSLRNSNYNIIFIDNIFTITLADLFIIVHSPYELPPNNANIKTYGNPDNPEIYYRIEGLTNGDFPETIVTGVLTRDPGENVGFYAIHRNDLTIHSNNYTVHYIPNVFFIEPARLDLYPTPGQWKTYGQPDPVMTYDTIVGFKFDDTIDLIREVRLGKLAGENVGFHYYTLTYASMDTQNYYINIMYEQFEIKPAPLAIIANPNQYKYYGNADPILQFTGVGLQFNDTNFQATRGRLSREEGEDIDLYPITIGTLEGGPNYYLTDFTSADFEIRKAEFKGKDDLEFLSKTFVYDGTVKSLAVTGTIPPNTVITYINNDQTEVGVYTVKARIDFGPNYEILELEAELTIVKAPQEINFEELDLIYIEDTPFLQLHATASSGLPVRFEVTYTSLPNLLTMTAAGLVTPLQVGTAKITAYQDGNENYLPATPVTRTLIIKTNVTDILDLIVDGVSYGRIQKETYILLDCDPNKNSVLLEVLVNEGMTVKPSNRIVVDVSTYGIHKQEIEVFSEDGTKSTKYYVYIDKRFPTTNIVYQKYENVLLVNNNAATNGGYKFTKYEWYKNNELIGTQQAYSAGDKYGMKLDDTAIYHAVLTLANGTKLTTCPIEIILKKNGKLKVYPNPVSKTQALQVDLEENKVYENSYTIYNVVGQIIFHGVFTDEKKEVNLPATIASGSYFLVLKSEGKHQSVQFIVKE